MSSKKRFYPPTEDQTNSQQNQYPNTFNNAPVSRVDPNQQQTPVFLNPSNSNSGSYIATPGQQTFNSNNTFSNNTNTSPGMMAPPPVTMNPPPTTAINPPPTGDHNLQSKRRVYIDPEEQTSYNEHGQPINPVQGLTNQMSNMNVGTTNTYGQQTNPNQNQAQYQPTGPSNLGGTEAIPVSIAQNYQCSSTFMRMTMNSVPSSMNLLNQVNIPFGCVIHPMAQPTGPHDRIPVVNFGGSEILRCRRCRAYINPFVSFIEGGRRWRCNLCTLPNDVPGDYFSPIDANGKRQDMEERPELSKGCVEFVAPAAYMIRPPQPPCYMFVIDVGYNSISSGMFNTAIETIKRILNDFPGSPRTRIGFITFDSAVHFYNLKSSLSTPQMLVVPDIDDVFLPLPEDMLVNLQDSKKVVEALLNKFSTMFQGTQASENVLGVALKAAFDVAKNIGGKVILMSNSLPSHGIGKLKNRDDPKLYGTDKETNLLNPDDNYFKEFALNCSRLQVSIDVFLFSAQYTDVATLGTLSQFTGGQLYYYPAFKDVVDGERFYRDLIRNITRETGFEAVFRVRTSKGLKTMAHFGNFFVRSADLLALPNVDADKAFAVQLSLAENTVTTNYVSLQAALLYTTSSGERRIRVFTQCLPVTANITEVFRTADNDAIITLTTKMAIEKALTSRVSDAREAIVNKCIEILTVYRTDVPQTGSQNSTSLMLPETLKTFPLYILALVKNVLFRSGTDIKSDERSYYYQLLRTLPVSLTIPFLYGRMFAIHALTDDVQSGILPQPVNLSSEKLSGGIFVVENGQQMWMWVSRMASPEAVNELFGVPSLEGIDCSQLQLPILETPLSRNANTLIALVRTQRPSYMNLHITREGDPREFKFFSNLIEDKDKGRNMHSYYEFLVNLHQRIQAKATKK